MATIATIRGLRLIDYLVLIWLIGAIFFRLAIVLTGRGTSYYNDDYIALYLMPQFGHLFIAGILIYRLVEGEITTAGVFALVLAIGYSAFGRPDWAQIAPLPYFVANAVFMLLVWLAARDRLPLFSTKPLTFLGGISYSFYLLHVLVFLVITRISENLGSGPALPVLISVIVTIAAAYLTTTFIERPGQRWIKRRFGG
jgi:peptidoglycan/LPS O-acetylase OafA/YrhL